VTSEINRRRAVFVLGKIDEILSWERTREQEKDVRFVELGEYLCEVRAKQYWRLEKLKSFDEFLEKRLSALPTRAAKLILPHDHPRTSHASTEATVTRNGLDKGEGARQGRAKGWSRVHLCTLGAQGEGTAEGRIQAGSRAAPDGERDRAVGDSLFKGLQEPITGG
jgi:transcriptional regulator of met regulon